ncbi:hypothetical protein ACFL5T_02450, partial [Gemmatimonadota bacterium]
GGLRQCTAVQRFPSSSSKVVRRRGDLEADPSLRPQDSREDSMAEKNRKKTYLILIAIMIVVLLITFL